MKTSFRVENILQASRAARNSVTPRVLELRKKKQVVIAYVARDESGRSSTYWKPATAEREAGDSF